ncbi:MAG: 6-carboxytetrahydropterin synthase QueD [Firmicutes bacterium]|nr:6-carboxytetrahydropterin synthase QueD [Bacillota bacterium]
MYELTVKSGFAAAHRLRNYQGKCTQLHGHTWEIEVKVRGEKLDQAGMLMDFAELKRILREASEELDHTCLNDLEVFADTSPTALNPTAENLAWYLYQRLAAVLSRDYPQLKLRSVTIWESPVTAACYGEALE